MRYRKKPVIIDAIQYDGDFFEALEWAASVSDGNGTYLEMSSQSGMHVITLEGKMFVPIGNYIICGIEGEFYSCEPNIFEKTYELIDNENSSD